MTGRDTVDMVALAVDMAAVAVDMAAVAVEPAAVEVTPAPGVFDFLIAGPAANHLQLRAAPILVELLA